MNITEIITFSLISLASIIFLYAVNRYSSTNETKLAINFIFLSESIFLAFFFPKFPLLLSLIISVFSLYFLVLVTSSSNFFTKSYHSLNSTFPEYAVFYFKPIGISLILGVISYEYFADGLLSSASYLIFLISLLLIFYPDYLNSYPNEKDFLLLFLIIISVINLLPNLIFKILFGYVGVPVVDGWIEDELIVYNLLGRPLDAFLSLLGYNVVASGKFIYYEDLESGIFRKLEIAESCSGIESVIVFVAAFTSFYWIRTQKFNQEFFSLSFIGLILSYISNIIRMAVVILVGHYNGIDSLIWVHKYAGWIIFTSWTFLFWRLLLDNNLISDNKI